MSLTSEDQPRPSPPATGAGRSLSTALKGRKIVLYFYPKDDTSGCTLEAKAFQS